MDVSCFFVKEDGTKCGSVFNCKEVEFRHPNYSDLGKIIFLCDSHFSLIFGLSVYTQEHRLPLEEEIFLKQQYINARQTFEKDKDEVVEKVKAGVGLDFFDMKGWNLMNWKKVDDAYQRWQKLRRKTCRFEWCRKELTNFRNLYVIRLYPKNKINYVNLFFCCLDHWEIFKKRCGLMGLKGSLNPYARKPVLDLKPFMK